MQFRIWATKILRDSLMKGYAVNNMINRIEYSISDITKRIDKFEIHLKKT